MGLDITGLIDMFLNHQTQSEKANLYGQESATDWQNKLQYEPQVNNAMMTGTANTDAALARQYGPALGVSPEYGASMYGTTGAMTPETIMAAQQAQSNAKTGVPNSNAANTLATNNASNAIAEKNAQDANAATNPIIAQAMGAMNTNNAKQGAFTSGLALQPQNQDLQGEAFNKNLLASLAGANRSTFDSSMDYPVGSRYGYKLNPYTGIADVSQNPTPNMQTALLTGQQTQPTGQIVRDAQGNVVGTTPHAFDPNDRGLPANNGTRTTPLVPTGSPVTTSPLANPHPVQAMSPKELELMQMLIQMQDMQNANKQVAPDPNAPGGRNSNYMF